MTEPPASPPPAIAVMGGRSTVWIAAVLILVVAVASRSGWLCDSSPAAADEIEYQALARRLLEGRGFTTETGEPTAYRTPGFPVALAAVYGSVGQEPKPVRATLAVVTSLSSLLLFFLCRACFGRLDVAVVAGLAWLSLANGQYLAGRLLAEPTAALLLLGSLLLLVSPEGGGRTGRVAPAGLLFGAAVLTRGYLLLAALGPALWLLGRRNLRLGLVYALSSLVLPCAWAVRNYQSMGVATLSTQGSMLIWHGNNAWARGSFNSDWDDAASPQRTYLGQKYPGFDQRSERERARILVAETRHDLQSHPYHILWLVPRKLLLFFSPVSYLGSDWPYLLFAPFAPIGFLALLHRRRTRQVAAFFMLPIVGAMLSAVLTFGDPRFRHPVDALIVALASFGLCHSVDRFSAAIMARSSPA